MMRKTFRELADLSGRVAVVTGGAGHIGTAICETLAELGSSVVVVDFNQPACEREAKNLSDAFSRRAVPLVVDMEDSDQVRRVPKDVAQEFGRMDILVNCAAFLGGTHLPGWATSFEEQSLESWRRALEVNLTGPFALTQACSALLKRSGHGSVINIGSIYGVVGPDLRLYEGTAMGNPAAYAASKGGLTQISRWLATVMAPEVRVNTITAGGVFRDQPQEFLNRYESRTPLGRMAVEQDFKGAVAFLASDLSGYVTGQNIVVDGGWTAW